MPNEILSLPSSGDRLNPAPPAWAEGFGEPLGFVRLRLHLLPPTPPVPGDPQKGSPSLTGSGLLGTGNGSEGRAGRMVLEPWADEEGRLDKVPAAGSQRFPSQGTQQGWRAAGIGPGWGSLCFGVRGKHCCQAQGPASLSGGPGGLVRGGSMETPMCSRTWTI